MRRQTQRLFLTVCRTAWLALLVTGCGAPAGVARFAAPDVGHPAVRVLLPFADSTFTITGPRRFVTQGTTSTGGEVVYYCSRPVQVTFRDGRWTLAEKKRIVLETDLVQVIVYPKDPDDLLTLNGQSYPGCLLFYPPKYSGTLPQVVNRAHVDRYLLGVLPSELGQRTENEFEAVKAQAVAARTYALSRLGQYGSAEYDLRADVQDQMYAGVERTPDWVRKAVAQTRGEVLRFTGNLIDAYYHSTCGGFTDNIEDVWPKPPQPYLVAADDDTFCRWSKYYTWTEIWDASTLEKNLAAYLRTDSTAPFSSFDRITALRTEGKTAGGRGRRLVVVTDRGPWEISADRIRWALGRPSTGGAVLESARFEIRPEYDESGNLARLTAQGGGYGHGVGMCQCGMIGRARAGQGYREILAHYYPGATIEKTY